MTAFLSSEKPGFISIFLCEDFEHLPSNFFYAQKKIELFKLNLKKHVIVKDMIF